MTLTRLPVLAACWVGVLFSVTACSSGYEKAPNQVLYRTWNEFHGTQRWPVNAADPKTFEILNERYGKDKRSGFYGDGEIVGSDPQSFMALSDHYAKDKAMVYFERKPFPLADAASFEALPFGYGRDKNDVYNQARPIHACDPPSFRWMDAFHWQTDSVCVYNAGVLVKGADPKSLVPLSSTFAKDNRHVYSSYSFAIVEGADPETFKADGVYGKDKHGCYKQTVKVPCGSR